MEYGPPPLFNQGVSARARLGFFALLAIALIIVDSRIRALETVRVGLGVVLYPIQQVLLLPSKAADAVGEYFTTIGNLNRENDALKRREIERSAQVAELEQLRGENERLRKLLDARERLNHGALLGQVVYESRDRFARKLVLDKGANDGVAIGMPVIDDVGVVGQITRVFPLSSELTLLTDKDQSIPVSLVRSGLRGVAFGGVEPGTLDLRFMAANADVENGDLAVTSGLDAVYPPGLPVAKVARIERKVNDQFARIVMTPAAGVENHSHLLVLRTDASLAPPRPEPAAAPAAAPRKGGRK